MEIHIETVENNKRRSGTRQESDKTNETVCCPDFNIRLLSYFDCFHRMLFHDHDYCYSRRADVYCCCLVSYLSSKFHCTQTIWIRCVFDIGVISFFGYDLAWEGLSYQAGTKRKKNHFLSVYDQNRNSNFMCDDNTRNNIVDSKSFTNAEDERSHCDVARQLETDFRYTNSALSVSWHWFVHMMRLNH